VKSADSSGHRRCRQAEDSRPVTGSVRTDVIAGVREISEMSTSGSNMGDKPCLCKSDFRQLQDYISALEQRITALEAIVMGPPQGDATQECREAIKSMMRNDSKPLEDYLKKWGSIPTDLMEGI
jgi:hypothetical protein